MFDIQITKRVQMILSPYIQEGDFVIDGTMGNGYDTLFLAEKVGKSGMLVAFDIQSQAIKNTKEYLEKNDIKDIVEVSGGEELYVRSSENRPGCILANCSHDLINHQKFNRLASCIMYNLGYLPSGDKAITTLADTSLRAIKASLPCLKKGGVLVVVTYPGHEAGNLENIGVRDLFSTLDQKEFEVLLLDSLNRNNKSPKTYFVYKR